MKETFQELVSYLKNPVLEKDENKDVNYRLKKGFHLLIICILTGLLLTPIFAIIEETGLVNMDDHALQEIQEKFSKTHLFLFGVVLAPLIEEVIFRAPITAFKKPNSFRIAFYTVAVLFGLVHITNFDMTTNVLLLSPLLVAPQIILGGYLGFIRVKFGLIWSILLHAAYNAFFMLISFASDLF